MFARRTFRIIKPVFTHRFYWSQATLTLSPNKTVNVKCAVEGDSDCSVSIGRDTGCQLAGFNLGDGGRRVDLIFYGGRHFARDKSPESPRLTLMTQDATRLVDSSGGVEEREATLYHHGGSNEGSGIALKGTEGEEFLNITAQGMQELKHTLAALK